MSSFGSLSGRSPETSWQGLPVLRRSWGGVGRRRLTRGMRQFSEARNWAKFHDPKSLAMALVGEVGELAELLQWVRSADQADLVTEHTLQGRLAEEMSDVLLQLLRLADVVDVDLAKAALDKLLANDR